MSKPVILTGVRSNEAPTIANYLGAILPMVQLQREFADSHQLNMFVPDLHSFTTPTDHSVLYQNTISNLKYFIAAGINPEQPDTYIYRQSFIPAHSELTWILDCFTYVGEMQRMTQYKDKSSQTDSSVTMGLMNYPVLMAADILLYNAEFVPIGEDQFQHLEITRDIAERFNNKFGPVFTIPRTTSHQTEFMHRETGLRIRSLTDPTKKMSKSSQDEKSKINLSDTPEVARKKILSATTDSYSEVNFDWERQPGITNLLVILANFTKQTQQQVNQDWQGNSRYGDLKSAVADAVAEFLATFQARQAEISDQAIISILESSEDAMNKVAQDTLLRAQKAVGLRSESWRFAAATLSRYVGHSGRRAVTMCRAWLNGLRFLTLALSTL